MVRKRSGKYDMTWFTYSDGAPFGFPGKWLAIHLKGEVTMSSCDSWSAVSTWYIYSFNPGTGEDPLVDGVLEDMFEGIELFYKRVP